MKTLRCHYEVLQVSKNASFKEIKKSYRKLVLQYHPDKHNNAEFYNEKIKEINAAYECLSNSEKRKVYDQRFSNTYNPNPFYSRPPTQTPSTQRIILSFKESYFGCRKQLKLIDNWGQDYFYNLEIPGGIEPDSLFMVSGNSKVSDFFVRVLVESDEHFYREGQDLYYTAYIPYIKFLMGGTIEIPWFDQIRTLNITKNTPENHTINIPRMGMPYPGRPGQFGNLFIKLKVRGMVDFSEALKEVFV
jgi:DnaJ-class molecular chaperone